jgi:ligand-binding sensor domain-containing protein
MSLYRNDMKTRYIFSLIILFLVFSLNSMSQSAMHQWRYYVNTSLVNQVVVGNNQVYAAYQNGLLQYDINNNETTVWSITNYLSDVEIETIYYDSIGNGCWIGYINGNIDFIQNNHVINIPFLKMSDLMGDKKIVSFQNEGKFILAAFSKGILKINIAKREITDTYYLPLKNNLIKDFKVFQDSIYVISDSTIYTALKTNPLLASENSWKKNSLSVAVELSKLHLNDNQMFVETNKKKLFQFNAGSWSQVKFGYFSSDVNYDALISMNNQWAVLGYDGIQLLDANFNEGQIIYRYDGKYVPRPKYITKYGSNYWIGDHECGLVKWKDNFNNQVFKLNGLPKSSVFSVAFNQGQLAITSGVPSRTEFSYNGDGLYVKLEDNWKLFDRYNQSKWKNKLLFDVGSVSFNPKNKGEFAVGSNSFVPLSISYSGSQIDTIFTDSNSLLKRSALGNGFTFVSDVKYDDDGNLWVLNPYTSNPLKVYTKNKTWTNINTSSSTTNSYAKNLVMDYNGNKWVSFPGVGIVGIKTGKTPELTSDDSYRIINDGESSGSLPSKEVNALAIDFDNNLWIGTDAGFAILYNAPGILDGQNQSFTVQRIKLKYEGNVEYLLGKTSISDIEIDGGNRKWIATTNAGLFLLSADGNDLIASYTTENSPLISNNLYDIQLNHDTGELFIVTDLGLVSFRVDATYGKSDYESTKVFPNPYKTNHSQGITIQGIKYDSDVKITDAAGNLVYKTTSNGGTAYWNAKNFNGERVSPGIYFFWTAPNNESGKKVGKVVVY